MSILDTTFQKGPLKAAREERPGRFREINDEIQDGPYEDYDTLRARCDKFIQDTARTRWQYERSWFESFLFYLGNQWIVFDRNRKQWRERHMRKWVPKPVTNRYAAAIDAIVGVLIQNIVTPSVWPATDDVDDIGATSVAEKILPVISQEIGQEELAQRLAPLIVLNGNGWLLPYYDKSDKSLGERELKHEYCMFCGLEMEAGAWGQNCPKEQGGCGMPTITGESAKSTKYNVGRMKCDVLTSLELYLPLEARIMSQVKRWCRVNSYPVEVVRDAYPLTGSYVQPTQEPAARESQHYLDVINYVTGDTSTTSSRTQTDLVPVYTYYEDPSEQYPEGLLFVKAGDGTVLEVGASPWVDHCEGKPYYYNPLTRFSYREVPNRLYSKTPATDLVPKQKQRNRLESLIEIAMMKGTYNSWMLPTGSSISQVTGEPSQIIRWTPQGTNGAKPEIITNAPIPNVVMAWLEKIDADIEEIAGTYDALKGQPPRGVSAGYAIQLLTERSFGRLAPVIASWQTGWTDVQQKLLRVFRNNVTEERLSKIRGDTGEWEVAKFVGADLKGSVDLRVEGGAAKPKTKLAEQALVETLGKMGILNGQDPTQKFAIAELFGMSHLLGPMSDDYRHAAREWDKFLEGEVPEVKLYVDQHILHILDHQKRAKSDVFLNLPEEMQQNWENHIAHHMQAAQQGMGQAPPDGQPPGGGKPKPAGSKANEQGDQNMNQIRQGGNNTYGAGGQNQHS